MQELLRYYPGLTGVPIDVAWRGPATRTANGLPFFGRLPSSPAIVYGHGYTGNGVGPSRIGGRILASLALGIADEWSSTPLVGAITPFMPPEPFRYVGGQLVRAAVKRKEKADDAGRRAGPLTRRLAALAPAGLVPVNHDTGDRGKG